MSEITVGHDVESEVGFNERGTVGHDIESEVGFNERDHGGSRHRK